jgi:hypothetical protein
LNVACFLGWSVWAAARRTAFHRVEALGYSELVAVHD